jgi:hypothetical protein
MSETNSWIPSMCDTLSYSHSTIEDGSGSGGYLLLMVKMKDEEGITGEELTGHHEE